MAVQKLRNCWRGVSGSVTGCYVGEGGRSGWCYVTSLVSVRTFFRKKKCQKTAPKTVKMVGRGGVLKRYIFFERPLSAKMLQSMCSILHNLLVLRGVEYSPSWKQTWIIAGSSGTRFQGPLFFFTKAPAKN